MKPTSHHVVPRLSILGIVRPLPRKSSWLIAYLSTRVGFLSTTATTTTTTITTTIVIIIITS